jgi:hypothetical protein
VLAPGAYALELRSRGTGIALGEVLVEIVPPGTIPVKSEPAPQCESAGLVRPRSSLLLATSPSAPSPATPVSRDRAASPPKARTGGVLDQVSPEAQNLPVAGVVGAAEDEGGRVLEFLLLAVVLAAGLALAVGVYESLRRGRPLT